VLGFVVEVFSKEYLPMAVFIEDVDKLFGSFNSVKRVAPGKALVAHLVQQSSYRSLDQGKYGEKELDLP
jgi:hypothetical protein